jgi:hypothetical protein
MNHTAVSLTPDTAAPLGALGVLLPVLLPSLLLLSAARCGARADA